MRVIKIVVDELPEIGCKGCFFLGRIDTDYGTTGDCFFCTATDNDVDWDECPQKRPTWCPLYPFGSLFNIFEWLSKGSDE